MNRQSMNCQAARRKIEEAELDQYQAEDVAAHLRACQCCRDFQSEHAALRRMVGSLEMVQAPADFDFRLRARLAASGKARPRPALFGLLPAPGAHAIAIAASFALLVTAALFYKQLQPARPAAAPKDRLAMALPSASPSTEAETQSSKDEPKLKTEPRTVAQSMSRESGPFIFKTNGFAAAKNPSAELKTRTRARRVSRPGDERAPAVEPNTTVAAGPKNGSLELSGSTAPVISLVVQVPAMNQPTRVSLEDRRGTTRTVSLPPVTFGSQELIERNGATRVSTSSPKGIW